MKKRLRPRFRRQALAALQVAAHQEEQHKRAEDAD
jgi:hypothetical protein